LDDLPCPREPTFQRPSIRRPFAIVIAFDDAAEALRHRAEHRELAPKTRASRARTLIELAEHGLRDPVLLKEAALARFKKR